jgi:anti-sigma-K factor RskA
MIDERMQEQAALHVLGALPPEEAAEFKKAMEADPELKEYVSRFTNATAALAGSVPAVEPPPQLRAKILARVAEPQKVVTLAAPRFRLPSWLPWSLATCLALLCLLLSQQDTQLKKLIGAQAQELNQLNLLATSLQSTTNDLQQTILALQETNRLANLKITMLNSQLASAPQAVAVTLWDNEKQAGVFVVENLKELPPNRDYQLWVLDNGTTPVDAGVFRVNQAGTGRVDFKPRQPIKVAGKFAVTEEVKGGVPAPTLKNLVLLGG